MKNTRDTAKRGPGQPPKPPERRRSHRLQIAVTPGEAERITQAAGQQGVSSWVRRLILAALGDQ